MFPFLSRRRLFPLVALPLALSAPKSLRAAAVPCDDLPLAYSSGPMSPAGVAVVSILLAAEVHETSAGRLYLGAKMRTDLNPSLRTNGTPRFFGLFGFTETQYRETLLGMGKPWQQALAADVMDPYGQADAAAWLVKNGRAIRGDPNG